MLDEWKDDYEEWMRPESLQNAWLMKQQQWHQFLRKAFRTHLFQFVSCYGMALHAHRTSQQRDLEHLSVGLRGCCHKPAHKPPTGVHRYLFKAPLGNR